MKCPSCGAEIGTNRICEYCGSQITVEMQKEQEQLNKNSCPRCGSTNFQISREKQGELQKESGKVVVRQTVAFCKDCGYTWYPNQGNTPIISVGKPRKTWLWVLGWIFIFPLPLTLILLKKKDMKPAVKYGIIAAAWLVFLLIAVFGKTSDNQNAQNHVSVATSITEETVSTVNNTLTVTTDDEKLSFVLSWDQTGDYGKKATVNAETDPYSFIAFYVPTGTYYVSNKSKSGSAQISVYSGIEYDGQWEQFVSDDCDYPIVVSPNEQGKTITVKEGQFIKLSDNSTNILFEMQ